MNRHLDNEVSNARAVVMTTTKKSAAAEEKSFNDAELEDIMNEIENLEREFSDDVEQDQPVAQMESSDEEEEVQSQEAEVVKLHPVNNAAPAKSGSKMPVASGAGATRMDFSVSGEMSMQLNFQIGEQSVSLCIDPSEGLIINMGGGAKFTIPLSGNGQVSKKTGT